MTKTNIVILTGTGRSGTTFMTRILRHVYGIGMSAEPKNVLQIAQEAAKLDLENEAVLIRFLERLIRTKVFNHMLSKGIVAELSVERCRACIQNRTPEGIILGMFRYVAELRGADFPGFKDPLVLSQVEELSQYLPGACYVNMVRRGENVAGSTLKFDWGATNQVAGIHDWKSTLDRGLAAFEKMPDDKYLNLRLELLEEDFDGFCKSLDQFMHRNIGRSNLEKLKSELQIYQQPLKNYPLVGLSGWIVKGVAAGTNQKLGYKVEGSGLPQWVYGGVSGPYILIDRAIRGYRRISKLVPNTSSSD